MGNPLLDCIKFYKPTDEYGFLSNFSAHSVSLQNKIWPTVEHYFQAQKFIGSKFEEEIRNLETPMEARNRGKDKGLPLRTDWEQVKNDVMREAVYAKFSQHKNLLNLLLKTGDAYLVEHTSNDSYWGDGGHGRGRNMLGHVLMETREKLK